MKRKMFYKKDYVKELLKIIRTETDTTKLPKLLSDYHEKDIAEAITLLSETERRQLYPVLGAQKVAEIFSYLDDSEKYIEELPIEKAAKVVSYMDADDALDILDDLTEHKKQELVSHLDEDTRKDVRRLLSYDDDEIGSCMTNNFICISDKLSIREAMSTLIRQAGEHDNISTIYVVDKDEKFVGAIDLKDLIIARENDALSDIISRSYPYVCEHEKINDCIDKIADYEEDSLPVLTKEGRIIGIQLPNSVNLKVVECEPSVKGNTATGATKIAKVETGYEVRVPLFVNEGDTLRIDTRTGNYIERA